MEDEKEDDIDGGEFTGKSQMKPRANEGSCWESNPELENKSF